MRLGWPTWDRASEPITVMGAALSAAVMPVTRVPVTITASVSFWATSCASTEPELAARTVSDAPKRSAVFVLEEIEYRSMRNLEMSRERRWCGPFPSVFPRKLRLMPVAIALDTVPASAASTADADARSEVESQARIIEAAIDAVGRDAQRRADDIGAVAHRGWVDNQAAFGPLIGQVVGAESDRPGRQPMIVDFQIGDRRGVHFIQIIGAAVGAV